MNYHKIQIDLENSTLQIVLLPSLTGVLVSSNPIMLRVYFKFGNFPNLTNYDCTESLPKAIKVSAEQEKFVNSKEFLRYTFFPPAQYTLKNGSYYMGIKIQDVSMNSNEITSNYSIHYTMYTMLSSCKFYDASQRNQNSNSQSNTNTNTQLNPNTNMNTNIFYK